jgi:glucose/arabinose dehydrogenase
MNYLFFLYCLLSILVIVLVLQGCNYSREAYSESDINRSLVIHDPNLKVEVVAEGLNYPTTMAFLNKQDILVLDKENGTVQKVINGTKQAEVMLDVNVANKRERGMLGIAIGKQTVTGSVYVFLYYTETKKEGSDICPTPNTCKPKHDPLGNRLYRYELVNGKLVNPKLLLDIPAIPVPTHNGGKVIIGPDNNVYVIAGDLDHRSKTQNFDDEPNFSKSGAIYRITQDGKPVDTGMFDEKSPLNKFYAYGIRNGFGIDFDPLTGNLWDTENGGDFGDEINLVMPGFNSGWAKVQGVWDTENKTVVLEHPSNLVYINENATYSSPEFTWNHTVAPTAIKFFNSQKLGKQYENDIFVGDYHFGNIYHFQLNQNRTQLVLYPPLADRIANTQNELKLVIFAEGFGGVSDLQVGPDGYLYVVSIGKGKIYRILPIS